MTMYFTDDSLFPENMQPLIITAAPFGPEWLPGDCDIPLSWDEQIQRAVDCYNAGATMLHVHLRDPHAGRGAANSPPPHPSRGRQKGGAPQMTLGGGGSISFPPPTEAPKPRGRDNDPRHMLTELDPKPEFV